MAGSVLPSIRDEAVAAVLLVDLASSSVVFANPTALAMVPDRSLPVEVDEWSDLAGLVGVDGSPLSGSTQSLGAVARDGGAPGVMVQRRSQQQEGPDHAQVLWLTGFPLSDGDGDGATADGATADGATAVANVPDSEQVPLHDHLERSALLVLLQVSAGPYQDDDPDLTLASMHNRAVIATDLSFTISDPLAPDDPLVWVNPAFERTTGYSREQVLGHNCRFLQGPGTDPAAIQRIRVALQRGEPILETVLNYRADGTAFWNQVAISPVLDPAGRLVNFVGVQSDVTARVDGERAREQALASERRARSRLALLADVGEAMTQIEPKQAVQRLAEILVQEPVRWCAVLLMDDEVELAAAAGIELHRAPSRFRPGYASGGDAEHDPLRDLRSRVHHGLVELSHEVGAYAEGTLTRWVADQLAADADGGPWVALAAPGRRGVRGVLLLGVPHLPLDAEEVDLLGEVARRTGLSLDNARLYAREHLVAETLQRSMLPEVVQVPGLDVWSYYAPGMEHAQVGGDWYDVMRMGDDSVGLVIGDVVGHDIEAASAMGQLRSVVRAYAADGQDPGPVLMRVDQLVGGMRITRSASMVYACLTDLGGGGWEMAWSRAGHLPPILVHEGEAEALMDDGGPMVGHGAGKRESPVRHLVPGDVLVLYTDGLIERRARPMKQGLDQLLEVCSSLEEMDAAGIGERLLAELGDLPEDDLALVVVRVPVQGEEGLIGAGARSRRWQLPGESSSIPRARALTMQVCELWGLDVAREAELAVSELVANAVLHGYGPIGLRLREDDGLLIEVEDANPTPPRRVDGHADRTGGFGLTIVATFAEWGWRAEGSGKVVWARVRTPRANLRPDRS